VAAPVPSRLNIARVTDDVRPKATNRLLIQERRRQAMRLRTAGLSVGAIGLRLAADPAVNSDGEAFPGGYGAQRYRDHQPPPSHDQLRKEASADLALVHERTRDAIDRDGEFMFDIAMDRIEHGILAIWNKVGAGSQLHVGRLWEAIELQAKLMGWVKSPVTVNVDQSTHLTAVSPQPNWGDPGYTAKFFGAMLEAGAEPPEILAVAQSAVDELLPLAERANAVDVESVEVEIPDA
jgi:hypothetical protein